MHSQRIIIIITEKTRAKASEEYGIFMALKSNHGYADVVVRHHSHSVILEPSVESSIVLLTCFTIYIYLEAFSLI